MTTEECKHQIALVRDEYLARLAALERQNNELTARLEALAELADRWAKDAYRHRDHTYANWIAVHKLANGDHDVVG